MTAVNPWLALPDGSPSHTLTRNIRAAHQALITTAGIGRVAEARSVRSSGTPGGAVSVAAWIPTAVARASTSWTTHCAPIATHIRWRR